MPAKTGEQQVHEKKRTPLMKLPGRCSVGDVMIFILKRAFRKDVLFSRCRPTGRGDRSQGIIVINVTDNRRQISTTTKNDGCGIHHSIPGYGWRLPTVSNKRNRYPNDQPQQERWLCCSPRDWLCGILTAFETNLSVPSPVPNRHCMYCTGDFSRCFSTWCKLCWAM